MNKRSVGTINEDRAIEYLQKNDFVILERNFRVRQGEIDVVGLHQNCLVFVEVKFRSGNKHGEAVEAVGVTKQRQICKVSQFYLAFHPDMGAKNIRYDVVTVVNDQVVWYQNAFDYQH